MQKCRTKLIKLQQDPTLTPSMSTVGIRPKQFIGQHNYHEMEQGKVQVIHDNDMYIDLYSTVEQQIRADAILLSQIYEEEKKQFEKQETRDPMSTILIQYENNQFLFKIR